MQLRTHQVVKDPLQAPLAALATRRATEPHKLRAVGFPAWITPQVLFGLAVASMASRILWVAVYPVNPARAVFPRRGPRVARPV